MVLKQRLEQRQVQRLILAPALQQAIKLLPLTNLELIEVIDTELSQNPMLEEVTPETSVKENHAVRKTREDLEHAAQGKQSELGLDAGNFDLLKPAEPSDFEISFQEYFDEGYRPFFGEKKDMPTLENTLSKSISLWEHLNWQANLTFFGAVDREIAQLIIGNVNEDGYLSLPVEEIAQTAGVNVEMVEEVRKKIIMFDPVGVASRDLKEVLLAQMDYLQIRDEISRRILAEQLHLLERSDFAQMARLLGIPLPELKTHLDVIKSLDPAPGQKYSQERTIYVVPDIVVTREDAELKVSLNDEGLPRLRINRYYKRLLAKASREENPEAYLFLKDRMKKALWFLRSLNQRDQTIFKVSKYIVDKQKDFLEKGMDFLKPMTLMEIAQEIGVHESTVGRVVANKHLETPRGVFPLKYFFHKAIAGNFGEEISSLRIKEKIRKLIGSEDRKHQLSDIEIGDILAKDDLKIARRTVAKYRTQLKIPPSHIRKRKIMMEGG